MDLRSLSRILRPLLHSRPIVNGALRLTGLQAPLTIRRDQYSIPYIDAATDDDAWFGLGFCQAQDRAFQLELRLRTQRGTLSQLVGEKTLPIDRLSRRIGFHGSAKRQFEALDADVRRQVKAFMLGINAGLSAGMRRRPLEFQLLQSHPSLWRPEDVIGVGKLVSFLLIGNWDVELARLKILLDDGPQALRDVDPVFASYGVEASGQPPGLSAAVDALAEDLSQFVEFAGAAGGSNAWALSGTRTASGRPLLASDPHLEPTFPPHWYLAHLRTPSWSVTGAALVGTPAIGIGHNGLAAWGITAGLADTVDLFIEQVGPDGCSVKRGQGFESCRRRTEVIEVKGRSPVVEEVLDTPRGPIIGPALDDVPLAISLRAVWLDARPARGFLRSHLARDFEGFRAEFEHWPLFTQNAIYADASGKIAWQLVGETPRRRKGSGTLPLYASDPDTGWYEDNIPLPSMPFVVDPPSGYLVSANNRPDVASQLDAPQATAPFLGVDWLDEYRASSIAEVLASRHDWDRDAVLRLQLDTQNLAWPEVREVLLAAEPATDAGRAALTLLAAWDGDASADSTPAALFELVCGEMWRRVVRARAPRSAEWALGRGFTSLLSLTTFTGGRFGTLVGHLRRQPEGWFARPWPEEIGDALDTLVQFLTQRFGAEPEHWAWGRVRPLTLEHPLSVVKRLAPLLNRGPFPWGGDGNTISQAGVTPLEPLTNPTVIASLRFAVEVGDWENARYVLPGGQSGDPFSPHYDDMLPLWLRGEGVPIAWSPEEIERAAVTTLQLRPLGA
jgi:penicillin amidase